MNTVDFMKLKIVVTKSINPEILSPTNHVFPNINVNSVLFLQYSVDVKLFFFLLHVRDIKH